MPASPLTRRSFLQALAAAAPFAQRSSRADDALPAPRFFTLRQSGGRWWLITPEGRPFFSLGLNHIDSSPLRSVENGRLWAERYGNSQERWLKESVAQDLREWGFNSVGWTQEVVIRGDAIHRHSPSFTYEEYQWLGLPYCHLLPFAETHQWENEVRHTDFFHPDFADWCDYVARSQCARFADDPKLIGYFYTDCPMWVHTRPPNAWKGPLFDPDRLKTEAGRAELSRLATQYYRVTHDAIRRYDPNHLIFGDRYEANAPLPMEVVEAALLFVDVLSFQDFQDPVTHLAEWHKRTGKPVLWADGSKGIPSTDPASGTRFSRQDGAWYRATLRALRDNPGCIGVHLCGAYLRNTARRRGLRDEREQPDVQALEGIAAAHRETAEWMAALE